MFHKAKINLILWIFVFLSTFVCPNAKALVTVFPRAPYYQYPQGSTNVSIYYGAYLGGLTNFTTDGYLVDQVTAGYTPLLDTSDPGATTNPSNLITVDIFSDQFSTLSSGLTLLAYLSSSSSSTNPVLITGASIVSGTTIPTNCLNCYGGSSSTYAAATYTAGSTLRLAFTLSALCADTDFSSSSICETGSGNSGPNYTLFNLNGFNATSPVVTSVPQTLSATMYANIVATSNPTGVVSTAVPSGTPNDGISFTLNLTYAPPTLTATSSPCNPASDNLSDPLFYFPGDGEIILQPNNYGAAQGSGAPLQYYDLVAIKSTTTAITPLTNTASSYTANGQFVDQVNVSSSSPRAEGFSNTTTGSDNQYQAAVYVENQAGMISQSCWGSDPVHFVEARAIAGVLVKGRCYIATAAYHSGDVYPVVLLREFRDKILSKFSWGRAFVQNYYRLSPPLAVWSWQNPWFRLVSLQVLTPLEIFAYLVLHPLWILGLLLGGLMGVFGVKRIRSLRTRTGRSLLILMLSLGLIPLSVYAQSETTEDSGTPYLDQMKKRLEAEDRKNGKPTGASPEASYTEELKKKLSPSSPSEEESYTDRIRKRLDRTPDPNQTDASYTDQIKSTLPPEDTTSVIQQVKAGHPEIKRLEHPPIKHAFALKIGINPGIQVTDAGGTHSFTDVYGGGWKPDVLLHYQYEWFHSENWGSFGPTLDFGVSYAGAPGLFAIPFNGSLVSQTQFSMVQVPALVGANYQFNLFRILRPYAQANIGPIGVAEIRMDEKAGYRDFSVVYSATGGVAFLMDWLEPKAMREAYDGTGFQHIYIVCEYAFLKTLWGNVNFTRNGLYSGFLFEF